MQIIHFTDNFLKLKSIIDSKSLRLKYCKEDFSLDGKAVSKAVHPMVSFSEYSIQSLKYKIITYGKYGVTFNREWVNKKGIHQVLYVDSTSLIASSLSKLLKARRKNAKNTLAPHVRLAIMMIKCFTKNSRGFNSKLKVDDFDFKSENEWRFVPSKSQINGNYISESRNKYLENEDRYNKRLLDYPLRFEYEDIKYIFVDTPEEMKILSSIDLIKSKLKLRKWNVE